MNMNHAEFDTVGESLALRLSACGASCCVGGEGGLWPRKAALTSRKSESRSDELSKERLRQQYYIRHDWC